MTGKRMRDRYRFKWTKISPHLSRRKVADVCLLRRVWSWYQRRRSWR